MGSQYQWIMPEGVQAASLRECILQRRGLTGERDQSLFASSLPPMSLLREPASLPGADAAAAALDDWLKQGLRIAIYGDYDADGLCAAAIMSRLLRLFDATPRVFIPHRVDEGYGVHADALRQLQAEGVQAVITVDCGIRSFKEAALAKELGLRMVITDHHRVERGADGAPVVPQADAVAHPSLGGCPFEHISGSVVAFKVAKRLIRRRGGDRPPERLRNWVVDIALPLAAMGLVPDVMPLLDENRVLVAQAVKRLPTCGIPGVQAILREARVGAGEVDARTLGFHIGPRLNASGRLDEATDALRVLDTDDAAEARSAARKLEAANNERKLRQDELVRATEALAVQRGLDDAGRASIVMADPSWHPGLLGLAAARLVEKFNKPVMLFGGEDQWLKASGRAPAGIDLHACLDACAALLVKYGGHAAAAGGSIEPANMPAFIEAFEQAVRAQMGQEPRLRTLQVDASMPIEQAMAAIDELRTLQPFGKDFPEPLIHCPGLRVHDASVLGADRTHLKVRVQSQGSLRNTELLLWRQADRIGDFRRSRMLEVVGSPKPSTNPRWDPSFEVKDFLFVD